MANFRKIGTDFSDGLRAPHYTNGRLLTAEDLQSDQQATLARLAEMGRGVGYGIIDGFVVTAVANNSQLRVTRGLGINRKGDVIQLSADSVDLPIQPITASGDPRRAAGRFEACQGEGATPTTTIDSGAYLLTVAPLAQLEGAIARQSCDGTETANCANQWEVEGVEFKIIRLTGYQAPTGNRAARNRNLLAHWFYGSDKISTLMRDPLQFAAAYSGFAQMAAEDFTECDLPLAVFYWVNNQLDFVDIWAVRRRLSHPYPASAWSANISDRRVAEGEARFLQFQTDLTSLQTLFGSKTQAVRAIDRFGYLPPVGFVPVNPFELIVTDVFEQELTDEQKKRIQAHELSEAQVLDNVRAGVLDQWGAKNVFNLENFFEGLLPKTYSIVHEDNVHDRLHQSWVQPPISMPPPTQRTSPFFEFVLPNNRLIEVNNDNFSSVIAGLTPTLGGNVFTKSATLATPSPVLRASPLARDATDAARINTLNFISQRARFVPPRDIFVPPARDDEEEPEPLVDIWVVDELLDPYRSELAKDMRERIDAAITALSAGSGGIFIGKNQFVAFNTSVKNAFVLNSLLWQAAHTGFVKFVDLLQLINVAKQPIFYVVFVRYRPQPQQRPLRV